MARDCAAILKAASIEAPCAHITVAVTSPRKSSKSMSAEMANCDRKLIIPASHPPVENTTPTRNSSATIIPEVTYLVVFSRILLFTTEAIGVDRYYAHSRCAIVTSRRKRAFAIVLLLSWCRLHFGTMYPSTSTPDR